MFDVAALAARARRIFQGKRIARFCICIIVIVAGLALRRFGHGFGLSTAVVKYGGSVLWGAMVFYLAAVLAGHQSRQWIVAAAAAIAVCVEFFRLVHTPWLDAFRLTTTGALFFGRVFSLWNIVAYLAGIGLAVVLDRRIAPLVAYPLLHGAHERDSA